MIQATANTKINYPKIAKNYFKIAKEVILETSDKSKIAIDHYDSKIRDFVLIICPSLDNDKNTEILENMSTNFFEFIDVVTMNYRGHNKESNSFTFTAEEETDLITVINYAKSRYKQILILGISFGAAIALNHISKIKSNRSDYLNGLIAINSSKFSDIKYNFQEKEGWSCRFRKIIISRKLYRKSCNSDIWMEKVVSVNVRCNIDPIPSLFINNNTKEANNLFIEKSHINDNYEYKNINFLNNEFLAEKAYLNSPNEFINTCKNWFDKVLVHDKSNLKSQNINAIKNRKGYNKINKILKNREKIKVNMKFHNDPNLEVFYPGDNKLVFEEFNYDPLYIEK